MVLPEWLAEAKSGLGPADYGWREQNALVDVMAGDLVLVGDMDASDGSRRVVAILDVDPGRRFFLAVLVTNDMSLAGADDLILDPKLTGLPYQVAVLARLAGYLWLVQVDERLGALTDEALDAVMAGYAGAENAFQNACRGVPLQDRSRDLRWSDLEAEAEFIHELSDDCTSKRHNEKIHLPLVDPELWPESNSEWDPACAETLHTLEEETRAGRVHGFAPSSVELMLPTTDLRLLRAYPALLAPDLDPAPLPFTDQAGAGPTPSPRDLAIADGLVAAPFVKLATTDPSLRHQRFARHGRRAEVLPELV